MANKKTKPTTASRKFKKRTLQYEIKNEDRDWYTPADLRGKDIKELKKIYTEYRDISQKRLKRLAEKYPDSEVLQYHPKAFPTIKQLKEESQGNKKKFAKALRHSLSDLSRFVQSPSTTLIGQKELSRSRLEVLKEHKFFEYQDDSGNIHDLLNELSEDEIKGVMKFVHWVQRTQHLNIMYKDEFAQKIRQGRFRESVQRSDYGKRNYGRWYEQITGLKAERSPRKTKSSQNKNKMQSSAYFDELR